MRATKTATAGTVPPATTMVPLKTPGSACNGLTVGVGGTAVGDGVGSGTLGKVRLKPVLISGRPVDL